MNRTSLGDPTIIDTSAACHRPASGHAPMKAWAILLRHDPRPYGQSWRKLRPKSSRRKHSATANVDADADPPTANVAGCYSKRREYRSRAAGSDGGNQIVADAAGRENDGFKRSGGREVLNHTMRPFRNVMGGVCDWAVYPASKKA